MSFSGNRSSQSHHSVTPKWNKTGGAFVLIGLITLPIFGALGHADASTQMRQQANAVTTDYGQSRIQKFRPVDSQSTSPAPTASATQPDCTSSATQVDLKTTNLLTEYPIPTSNTMPAGITTGSDGALWFSEAAVNKIGRLTTNGQFTEYPLPSSDGTSRYLYMGPDNAVWFTEGVQNAIGRITVDGKINEFTVPSSGEGGKGTDGKPTTSSWPQYAYHWAR